MNILMFLAHNWHDILVVILLIASVITGIRKWIKINGPIWDKMSNEERIAYVTRLIQNLIPIALVLVTDAEIKFGGGTGPLKRSYVIDELYKRIPDEYKKYITEDNLDQIINDVLDKAEDLWVDNPKVRALMSAQTATKNIKDGNPYEKY